MSVPTKSLVEQFCEPCRASGVLVNWLMVLMGRPGSPVMISDTILSENSGKIVRALRKCMPHQQLSLSVELCYLQSLLLHNSTSKPSNHRGDNQQSSTSSVVNRGELEIAKSNLRRCNRRGKSRIDPELVLVLREGAASSC